MRTFERPQAIRVKCDLHDWMRAWILVLPHPFHSATGRTGSFEIRGAPAGEYRLVAWHGHLGRVEREVVLAEGATVEVDLTFDRR